MHLEGEQEALKSEVVKYSTEPEYRLHAAGTDVLTCLHLAANEKLTRQLFAKSVTAVAHETIRTDDNSLPSEVAGRLSGQPSFVCLI